MKIKVKVFPKNKEQKVIEKGKDSYQVKIKKAADKNKANEEMVDVLADYFKVSKNQIRIIRGQRSRIKIIEIIK